MRKLIWWGVTGLAVVAGGYRTFRYAEARPGSPAGRQILPAEGTEVDPGDSVSRSCGSAARGGGCSSHQSCSTEDNLFASGTKDSVVDSPPEDGVIELGGSASAVSPVIYIPPGEEPPLALPPDITEVSEDSSPAPFRGVMPYCDDDSVPVVRMPYAADDPWPATRAGGSPRSSGWFEDSEEDEPGATPECREDDNLSRQYPGLPIPAEKPATNTPKKAAPWHHEGEPFLPVLPEVRHEAAPAEEWWVGGASRFIEGLQFAPASLRKHVSLKFLLGRDNENSARQPVDTLEARPSDVRNTGTEPGPF